MRKCVDTLCAYIIIIKPNYRDHLPAAYPRTSSSRWRCEPSERRAAVDHGNRLNCNHVICSLVYPMSYFSVMNARNTAKKISSTCHMPSRLQHPHQRHQWWWPVTSLTNWTAVVAADGTWCKFYQSSMIRVLKLAWQRHGACGFLCSAIKYEYWLC